MSTFNIMVLFSLANILFRSQMIYQIHFYLGLVVMCGFIIYDTQLIVEKNRMGSKDYIAHSLDLFIDFINVFRHLLVILTQKVCYNFFIDYLHNVIIIFFLTKPYSRSKGITNARSESAEAFQTNPENRGLRLSYPYIVLYICAYT
jgi:hypothetical protein